MKTAVNVLLLGLLVTPIYSIAVPNPVGPETAVDNVETTASPLDPVGSLFVREEEKV